MTFKWIRGVASANRRNLVVLQPENEIDIIFTFSYSGWRSAGRLLFYSEAEIRQGEKIDRFH
jgi:hypothetical protein